ncbi:hypothetical protein HDE_04747 [Halotydeus destructor]|nr:hypothetical protein HDE_04747 [Halotydeus destructor]
MEDPDGFTSIDKYVPFYPEDSHLFGLNFQSTFSCKTFYSQARTEQIPEHVRHLGNVELIQERTIGWGRRKLLLVMSNNLSPDTEFSVRLYRTRAGDPNLYGTYGGCLELFFQMFDGFALGMAFVDEGLHCKETHKRVGRLIVHSPFKYSRKIIYGKNYSISENKSYVKLHCHDGHFETCKQRLAHFSTVFKVMFQSNFRESYDEDINLSYVHRSVLEIVMACVNEQPLHFEDEHFAKDVLVFTHMFDIPILHQATQNFLLSELRLDNVFAMMDFAKMYQADILHKYCLRFIGRKIKLFGSKALIGLEEITIISHLRQLVQHCDTFKLYEYSFIYRSDNGSGVNDYVGYHGPPQCNHREGCAEITVIV